MAHEGTAHNRMKGPVREALKPSGALLKQGLSRRTQQHVEVHRRTGLEVAREALRHGRDAWQTQGVARRRHGHAARGARRAFGSMVPRSGCVGLKWLCIAMPCITMVSFVVLSVVVVCISR